MTAQSLQGSHRLGFEIAAWSVDGLGRSLQDLVGFPGETRAREAVGARLVLERLAELQAGAPQGGSFSL